MIDIPRPETPKAAYPGEGSGLLGALVGLPKEPLPYVPTSGRSKRISRTEVLAGVDVARRLESNPKYRFMGWAHHAAGRLFACCCVA